MKALHEWAKCSRSINRSAQVSQSNSLCVGAVDVRRIERSLTDGWMNNSCE